MTADDFVILFPEFAPLHEQYTGLIAATLAQVELRVSDSWGDEREEIIGLECAASLAANPLGRAAQLQAKDGSTTYSKRLAERVKINGCAHSCRVI